MSSTAILVDLVGMVEREPVGDAAAAVVAGDAKAFVAERRHQRHRVLGHDALRVALAACATPAPRSAVAAQVRDDDREAVGQPPRDAPPHQHAIADSRAAAASGGPEPPTRAKIVASPRAILCRRSPQEIACPSSIARTTFPRKTKRRQRGASAVTASSTLWKTAPRRSALSPCARNSSARARIPAARRRRRRRSPAPARDLVAEHLRAGVVDLDDGVGFDTQQRPTSARRSACWHRKR